MKPQLDDLPVLLEQGPKIMQILVDIHSQHLNNPKGIENFALGLVDGLSRQGESIVLAVASCDAEVARERFSPNGNVRVVKYGELMRHYRLLPFWLLRWATASRLFQPMLRCAATMAKLSFDEVYKANVAFYPSHLGMPSLPLSSASTIHAILEGYGKEKLRVIETHLRRSHTVVTSWPHPYRDLLTRYPQLEERLFMVPFTNSITEDQRMHADCDIDDRIENGFIFYPAVIVARKNHRVLITATSILRERGDDAPQFVFTGGCDKSGLTEELKQYAAELDVADRFIFLGDTSTEQVRALYQHCGAAASASLSEAGMAVIHEGVFYGKPVFCPDIPEARAHAELYDADICFFDPRSPEDCAEKIVKLRRDADAYNRRNAQAQRFAKAITPEYVAHCYADVLRFAAGQIERPSWFPFLSPLEFVDRV